MSKKLKDLKWESVALSGFPASLSDNFQGFVGLEECTSYGLEKDNKYRNKKKQQRVENETTVDKIEKSKIKQRKRKKSVEENKPTVPNKIFKLNNGFIVESSDKVTPSITNEIKFEIKPTNELKKKKKRNKKKNNPTDSAENKDGDIKSKETERDVDKKHKTKKRKNKKANVQDKDGKRKVKLGEDIGTKSDLTPEDMLSWAEFKLPEPIIKALMELGFKKPTKIQELSLPAAIHGRRDILGAAETGSGKTLAFGLPILNGIMEMKEKGKTGLDVYNIPYKKTSAKKKPENMKKNKTDKIKKNKKSPEEDENGDDDEKTKIKFNKDSTTDKKSKKTDKNVKSNKISKNDKTKQSKVDDNVDFIKEIEVPLRKRVDEGNDSDDSDNYIHLSDMLDSDDLADSDDDKENEGNDSETLSDEEKPDDDHESDIDNLNFSDEESSNEVSEIVDDNSNSESDVDELTDVVDDKDNSDDENGEVGHGEADENLEGIGCVKVIDNIEIPGHMVFKTGKPLYALILTPTRELAMQISHHLIAVAKYTGIGCVKVIDNIEIPGHMVFKTGKPLYALILTPTRELAMQISHHLIAVAKYTGIRVATIVGGMASVKQERILRTGPEIVVATPGRLWELVTQGEPHLQQLESVKFLAIDETDRMVERGHFEELHPLLERLNADEGKRGARQNFVFSATLTMVHELPAHMRGKKVTKRGKIINRKIDKMTPQQKIKRLVDMIGMTDPKVVDITTQNLGTAETLTESRIACSIEMKDAYLYYILKRHPGRTIVFCNSISSVRRLSQLFTLLKCHPLPLHASLQQRQRLRNLERFRDDPNGILMATDVAARGLDIPDVDHVVHYQVPKTAENYVHRSGRTARANKEGITILMMEPSEAYHYLKLCRTLNKTSELPTFPVPPSALLPLKELMNAARDLESLELKKRRAQQAEGWRERVAREMDIVLDDDDVPVKSVDPKIDKAVKIKRRQLESLLTRPLFPKGFSFKYPTLNDPAMFATSDENALQVMKKAMETGQLKKDKRTSKNAPLIKLHKSLKK